jgi:hypothetical protein
MSFLNRLVGIGLPSAMLYFFFIIPLRKVNRARAWLQTRCVVLSSSVEEDQGESGLYRVLITYVYEVAGQTYSSSRYDFSTGATAGLRRKKTVVRGLAPGRQAVCYVNPANPGDSVIKRGVTWDMVFWGVFGGVLLVVFSLVP